MAVFGTVQTVREQALVRFPLGEIWAYVEAVLTPGSVVRERVLQVKVGTTDRVELGGGAFALEQAYQSKRRDAAAFESHRRFIDFQLVVRGEEYMEFTDVGPLVVKDDFAAERDLLFYQLPGAYSTLRVHAGELAVFFPVDAHRPSLAIAEPAEVWKTVIKIPVV